MFWDKVQENSYIILNSKSWKFAKRDSKLKALNEK